MQLKEVNDKKSAREFILFPVTLYKNDANWIRPLDKDIEQVFNPEKKVSETSIRTRVTE